MVSDEYNSWYYEMLKETTELTNHERLSYNNISKTIMETQSTILDIDKK